MSKIKLNPECWNCGNTVNDKICPVCKEHIEDEPNLCPECKNPLEICICPYIDNKTSDDFEDDVNIW